MAEESKVRSSILLFRRVCAVVLFCARIKETSHPQRMAGAFHQGRSSEMDTMSVFANVKAGIYNNIKSKYITRLVIRPPKLSHPDRLNPYSEFPIYAQTVFLSAH